MKNYSNIKTTDTLKGIAITAVLTNHYLNLNVSGDQSGFANAWIAIFFILSGYGIFYSLYRQFDDRLEDIFSLKIFRFYYQRLIRIFPLLWGAWLLQLIMVQSDDLSIWTLFGIHGTGHYWFLPALIQCYLLAPFIYFGVKRNLVILLIILICGFFLLNIFLFSNQAPEIIKKIFQFANTRWRDIYFFHIILFLLGMLITKYLKPKAIVTQKGFNGKKVLYDTFFWCFVFATLILMVILKIYSSTNHLVMIAFNVFPLLLIASLCIFSLICMVENKLFSFLGKISYPIYLFHMTFYLLLGNLGEFQVNSIKEFLLFVVLFPFFIFSCKYIGLMDKKIGEKLKSIPIFNNAQQATALDGNSATLQSRQ